MWPVLLVAAVVGTGICAKNLFFNNNRHPTSSPQPSQTEQKTHDECEADTSPKKIRGKHTQQVVAKSSTGNQDPNDTNISSLPLIEDGEFASSILTEEPPPELPGMDQLEAELWFELQKLASWATDAPAYEEIRPDLGEPEVCLFLIFPYA